MTMTRFVLSFALLLFPTVVAGCGDEPAGAIPPAWMTTKAECAGAYRYSRNSYGPLGVPAYKTTVAINGDQAAARKFERWENGAITAQWVETSAEVGTHSEGAAALTMEQLYDDCRTKILSGAAGKYDIVFETDANGALQRCTSQVAPDCTDDCSSGVVVQDFACGGLPATP
jgi:hypothetical protein